MNVARAILVEFQMMTGTFLYEDKKMREAGEGGKGRTEYDDGHVD